MADPIITNNAPSGITIWGPLFQDETLNATGALTYAAGTLLGRLTANGKLTAYLTGGILGENVPVAVLHEAHTFAGAGDQPIKAIIAGRLRNADMVAHGVGAITVPEQDLLRQTGIIPLSTQQLMNLDNS